MEYRELTSVEDYEEFLKEEGILFIDFYKDDCSKCRFLDQAMTAYQENFESAKEVKFAKIKLENVGEDFFRDKDVMGTPTVLLVKGGEEKERFSSVKPPEFVDGLVQGI